MFCTFKHITYNSSLNNPGKIELDNLIDIIIQALDNPNYICCTHTIPQIHRFHNFDRIQIFNTEYYLDRSLSFHNHPCI